MISFTNLYKPGQIIEKNEFFSFYINPEASAVHLENYFQLHFTPAVSQEWSLLQTIALDRTATQGIDYIRFVLPPDQKLMPDGLNWVSSNYYGIEQLALLALNPEDFKLSKNIQTSADQVSLKQVNQELMPLFIDLNYQANLEYGPDFADQQNLIYQHKLHQDNVKFWLIDYRGQIVGSLITYHYPSAIEIDSFEIQKQWQRLGIGSRVQEILLGYLVDDQQLILKADLHDTPYDMYLRQGYQPIEEQMALIHRLDR